MQLAGMMSVQYDRKVLTIRTDRKDKKEIQERKRRLISIDQ